MNRIQPQLKPPVMVYHGTDAPQFRLFNLSDEIIRMVNDPIGAAKLGVFFSESRELAASWPINAKGPRRLIAAEMLNMRHPKVFKNIRHLTMEMAAYFGFDSIAKAKIGMPSIDTGMYLLGMAFKYRRYLMAKGYDCATFIDGMSYSPLTSAKRARSWVCFEPKEIRILWDKPLIGGKLDADDADFKRI